MLKKLFVTAAAAAAVSVPLAGAAVADPAPDNPGLPGYFGPPGAPGLDIKEEIAPLPGSVAGWAREATGGSSRSPGDLINNFAPANNK